MSRTALGGIQVARTATLIGLLWLMPGLAYSRDNTPPPVVAADSATTAQEATSETQGTGTVDIVFCVDCSGSMNMSMQVAKSAIAVIARDAVKKYSGKTVRFGLVRYGDALRRFFVQDLTADHELFLKNVGATEADSHSGEEFVGDIIERTTEKLQWNVASDSVHKLYVIGNESADQGPESYRKAINSAKEKSIAVSAFYCNAMPVVVMSSGSHLVDASNWLLFDRDVKGQWLEIAQTTGGEYLQLLGGTAKGIDANILAVAFKPALLRSLISYMDSSECYALKIADLANAAELSSNASRLTRSGSLRTFGPAGNSVGLFFVEHPNTYTDLITM